MLRKAMATIYYDLSEQFLISGSTLKYYGIVRTVMEVGYELSCTSADVKFVVFSPAHDRFFEVSPRMGKASPTGIFDPDLPAEARPVRLRYSFAKANKLRDALYPAVRAVVKQISLRRWKRALPEGALREVDLTGQILVSLGRPKMMADYLTALNRDGNKIRFYPLLHDMIPLYEYGPSKRNKHARSFAHDNHVVVTSAEKILTNSVFTKTEVERFSATGHLPDPPEIIPVLLPHELRDMGEPIEVIPPSEPYLLAVGLMTGRKNLECILQAMLRLHKAERPVPMLVLAGARRKRIETYLSSPELAAVRDRVQFVLDPNQSELRTLYKQALALVIPSHMEGFGLPLGEALWLGTPGIASDVAALREVGGDLASYFDPNDPSALAGLIDKLQSDPVSYAALKAHIASRHETLRTWKDVAADIITAVSPTPEAS
jgi:glycosyltransferase involved in cell wall biosynthesis